MQGTNIYKHNTYITGCLLRCRCGSVQSHHVLKVTEDTPLAKPVYVKNQTENIGRISVIDGNEVQRKAKLGTKMAFTLRTLMMLDVLPDQRPYIFVINTIFVFLMISRVTPPPPLNRNP